MQDGVDPAQTQAKSPSDLLIGGLFYSNKPSSSATIRDNAQRELASETGGGGPGVGP